MTCVPARIGGFPVKMQLAPLRRPYFGTTFDIAKSELQWIAKTREVLDGNRTLTVSNLTAVHVSVTRCEALNLPLIPAVTALPQISKRHRTGLRTSFLASFYIILHQSSMRWPLPLLFRCLSLCIIDEHIKEHLLHL